jgi:hypothetical protein
VPAEQRLLPGQERVQPVRERAVPVPEPALEWEVPGSEGASAWSTRRAEVPQQVRAELPGPWAQPERTALRP